MSTPANNGNPTGSGQTGRVVQVIGPVLDVEFGNGYLPPIYTALRVTSDEVRVLQAEEAAGRVGGTSVVSDAKGRALYFSKRLGEAAVPGDIIGYDPWLHTPHEVERFRAAVERARAKLQPLDDNPLDKVWPGRPAAEFLGRQDVLLQRLGFGRTGAVHSHLLALDAAPVAYCKQASAGAGRGPPGRDRTSRRGHLECS